MKMKYEEMSSQKVPKPSVSSLSLKLRNAVLVTSLLTAFGIGGSKATDAVKPADVGNQNMAAQTVVDTGETVTITINGEKKELKKISVREFKNYREKNVRSKLFKEARDYETGNPLGYTSISIADAKMSIILGNGGWISSVIIIPKNPTMLGFDKAISIHVFNKNGEYIGEAIRTLDQLEKNYKAMTGKELNYVVAAVEHDIDKEHGEYVQFYITPADTFEDVLKGNIKSGRPVMVVLYHVPTNAMHSDTIYYTVDD